MSYSLMIERDDNGELVVKNVSGLDNVPDRITISGHRNAGPHSAPTTINVSDGKVSASGTAYE